MTFVVSLAGFRPPPRFDSIAWTSARIEEAALREGPWTALETQPLSPVDADPRAPAERAFTTALATLTAGWYRVVFLDDDGAEASSDAVSNASGGEYPPDALPPTVNDVRSRSALLRRDFPAGSADPHSEPTLRQYVTDAIAMVQSITGRTLDETLPTNLIDLAFRAVTLMTEKFAVRGDAESTEEAAGGRRLRSQSAGPWSESYFAPGDLQMKNGRPMVDPNDVLDEVLWALMTEEMREEFIALATGQQQPAGAVTQFDYRLQGGGYGLTPGGWPGY